MADKKKQAEQWKQYLKKLDLSKMTEQDKDKLITAMSAVMKSWAIFIIDQMDKMGNAKESFIEDLK